MNVDHLDCLFQEYGYDVKERTASYRVYLLNQGMYHGAEIQIMDDDIDATPILDRYSKLGYHAKQQRFKSIEQAESYLFKGFFNTQTTANDINRRYTEFAANQVKHYCNCGIKYQYISMPYSIYSEGAEDTVSEGPTISEVAVTFSPSTTQVISLISAFSAAYLNVKFNLASFSFPAVVK